ncbi:SPOCS domain-containing protein [Romboutsia sp.]|uniref:SPOCS domain-containing protein n=1 Tax=Romboutsia sp. TaxID=1965302 RepID=UPI003F326629
MSHDLKFIKSSSSNEAVVGDIITYELLLTNDDCLKIEDIVITDLLSPELKFIEGSIRINLAPKPDANIISGVSINKLEPTQNIRINFDAQIINKKNDMIINASTVEYTYRPNLDKPTIRRVLMSNAMCIYVKRVNIDIIKLADKENLSLNDTVTYTIKLVNDGDLDLDNVVIFDKIPNSIKVIDGSFNINSQIIHSVNLKLGVNVGSLKKGCSTTITYTGLVVGSGSNGKIINKSYAKYTYTLLNGYGGFGVSNEVSCAISIAISNFKQINIGEYINIEPSKPNIDQINDIKAKVSIKSSHIIQTPVAVSSEGQHLSGYKLVIQGVLSQVIQYTSTQHDQQVYSMYVNKPFSSFIILPYDFEPGRRIDVNGEAEDIYHSLVNERYFFTNTTILLVAKVMNF